jgi:hypothetical protein
LFHDVLGNSPLFRLWQDALSIIIKHTEDQDVCWNHSWSASPVISSWHSCGMRLQHIQTTTHKSRFPANAHYNYTRFPIPKGFFSPVENPFKKCPHQTWPSDLARSFHWCGLH